MSNEPKSDTTKSNNMLKGVLIGLVTTIIGNYFLILFQENSEIVRLKTRTTLEEKMIFVNATNDYLSCFRDWFELMNYYVFKDTNVSEIRIDSEFDSLSAHKKYLSWKKEIDYSYGKLLLLSDNEFGPLTFEVSTVLHLSIADVKNTNNLTFQEKNEKFSVATNYFFKNWLTNAKKQISKYNSGERDDIYSEENFQNFKLEFENN